MGHFGPYPYQPFPKAVSPVPVGDTQEICFRFDQKWLPYMMAALKTLAVKRTWETDQARAVGEANNLLVALMLATSDCMPTITDGHDCVEFGPNAPFIEYFPTNPYFQAGAVPIDYLRSPWRVLEPGFPVIPFVAAQSGDVFTGYLGNVLPPDLQNEVFPRIRVHVRGAGVVELHLLKLPQGGAAAITTDDDLATLKYVELEADILAVPQELIITEIIEIEINGDGPHHIDINYTPRVELPDVLESGTGGGLRKVVLCGFAEIAPVAPTWWERGDELEEDMRLRVDPDDSCIIQNECSPGVWETWYDPRECIEQIVRDKGAPSPAGTIPEDEHFTDCPVLQGSGLYQFPTQVSPGDTVTITGASGGWSESSDPAVTWACPSGQDYLFGSCIPDSGPDAGAGAPIPDAKRMRLVAYYDGLYYDAYNTTIVLPADGQQSQLLFLANDADLSDNQGSITFCVDVLHPAPPVVPPPDYSGWSWAITLDLENVDYSWLWELTQANGNNPKGYVVGTGLQSGLSGNEVAAHLKMHLAGGAADIRVVDAEVWTAVDVVTADQGFTANTDDNITTQGRTDDTVPVAGEWVTAHTEFAAGNAQINPGFDTRFSVSLRGGGNDPNPYVPNVIIRKVVIAGNGAIPSLIHW